MEAIVIEKKSKVKVLTSIVLMIILSLNCNLFSQVSISGAMYACAGGPGNIYTVIGNSQPGYGVTNIAWTVNNGSGTPILNSQGLATQILVFWNNDPITGNNTGNLQVTVTSAQIPSGGGATFESDSKNINITGIANAGALHGPSSVCTSHSATFYVDPIPGASSYQWTIPSGWSWVPNTSHTGASIQIVAPSWVSSNNVLSVVGADPFCGTTGSSAASLNLSSVSPPTINFGGILNIYIDAPTFKIPVNLTGGYWSGNGVSEEGFFNAASVGLGEHEVTYYYDNGICSVSKTLVINVNPPEYNTTALTFAGAQGVHIPNISAYNIGNGDFTLETWVKFPVGTESEQTLFASTFDIGGPFLPSQGMIFYINSARQFAVDIRATGPILSSALPTSLFDGTCKHLAVTRSNGTITFYYNGQAYPVVSGSSNSGQNIDSPWYHTIGYAEFYTGTATPLTGTMDELRFWNVARSQSAIQANMSTHVSPSSNLIGYWDFNEGGTIVHDVSGLGNHGTLGYGNGLLAGSTPARVQMGCYYSGETGLYYDGSTKYATITPLNFAPGTGAFSLEAWARIEACNCVKDQVLISNKTNNNPTSGFVWYVKDGTKLVMEFANGGNPIILTSALFPNGLNLLNSTSCQNFAVVRDPYGMVTFYISGVALSTAYCAANINTSEPFYLGHHDIGSEGHAEFKGLINEVRFWMNYKTPLQLATNQNITLSPTSIGWTQWTDLVGYYTMKETMGEQRIFDHSWVQYPGFLGNNNTVETYDPLRTFDQCFSADRIISNTNNTDNSSSINIADNTTSLYPNPFNNNLNIFIKDYVPGNYLLEIFDMSNRLMYAKIVDSPNTTLEPGGNLVSGMYLLKITNPEQKIKNFKIIKSSSN